MKKEPYNHTTLKAEGYMFIPYQGQVRFGVELTQGVLSYVPPDWSYNSNFGTTPSSPSCRVYETDADLERIKVYEEQIKYFMVHKKAKKTRIQMAKGHIDLLEHTIEGEKK